MKQQIHVWEKFCGKVILTPKLLNVSQRFFTPTNWDAICRHKLVEGLGFHKTKDLNKAMLSKVAWELVIQSDKLRVKIFSQKYLKYTYFCNAIKKSKDSSIWKWILWTQNLIQQDRLKGRYRKHQLLAGSIDT